MVFPLTALVLVMVARLVLANWHHMNLLKLAVPLLLAMAVIRLTVHALKAQLSAGRLAGLFERAFAFGAWGVVALHLAACCPP